MKKYILSIDQGTTGTTALLIDAESFALIGEHGQDFTQYLPSPGLVEHDLDEIWATVKFSITSLLAKFNVRGEQITSIGITNQRETTCAYSKSGEVLAKAIVWQDRRTSSFCKENASKYVPLKQKTGLPLDSYFSATKMKWLIDNNSNVSEAAKNNNLNLSTIDSFLLYRLTSGASFFTDASNASRTLLLDLKTGDWDDELLAFFGLSKKFLPEVKDSFGDFGRTNGLDFLPNGIPVTCILGDQQAALFGQRCFNKGDMKITYGTGAFMLVNIGDKPIFSNNGLITTIAYKHNNKIVYALEGATYIAGAAVQWLRDNLKLIKSSSEIETLASQIKDLNDVKNVLFFPFFTGIASPYWISDATATITGLTRDSNSSHIAYACLEGIALSVNDLVETVKVDIDSEIKEIRVDGGASSNNIMMNMQSSIANARILRPKNLETTAFGVAIGSLIGNGSLIIDQLRNQDSIEKIFEPSQGNHEYYAEKKTRWKKIISTLYS